MRTSAVSQTRPAGPRFPSHMKSPNVPRSVCVLRVGPPPPATFCSADRSIDPQSGPVTRYGPAGRGAPAMLTIGWAAAGEATATGLPALAASVTPAIALLSGDGVAG